jgi:hypothetical protein
MAIQTHYETIVIKEGGRVLSPFTGKSYPVSAARTIKNAKPYGANHYSFEVDGIVYVVHRMYVVWKP